MQILSVKTAEITKETAESTLLTGMVILTIIAQDEELRKAHTIYITGGEPFKFSNPNAIAKYLKTKYHNIRTVRVYTGAVELAQWLKCNSHWFNVAGELNWIDGVTVSLKNKYDVTCFMTDIVDDERIELLDSNMLYVFGDLAPKDLGNFIVKPRVWMEDFIPDKKSIFRRIQMCKFIEVQVVVRDREYVNTTEALLNADDICMVTPYNGGTLIALRSVGTTIELEDRYEDIRYKLFTDEVH